MHIILSSAIAKPKLTPITDTVTSIVGDCEEVLKLTNKMSYNFMYGFIIILNLYVFIL